MTWKRPHERKSVFGLPTLAQNEVAHSTMYSSAIVTVLLCQQDNVPGRVLLLMRKSSGEVVLGVR